MKSNLAKKARLLLPWLLAKATGVPRYLPEIKWSSRSITHNVFRLYESIFWRRYGIRREAMTWHDDSGKLHREFYTVEAHIAHGETWLRENWFKVAVSLASLSHPKLAPMIFAIGAIAVDPGTDGGSLGVSPKTFSHTCTGSDLLLIGGTYQTTATDNINAHTYAAVTLTKADHQPPDVGINYYGQGVWCKAGPATGANTMSIGSSSGNVSGACVSFSGCSQTSTPDSKAKGAVTSTTTVTGTTTVVAANSWLFMMASCGAGSMIAGANTTLRLSTLGASTGVFDSNGPVSAGAQSLIATWTGTQGAGYVIISFAPSGGVATVSPNLNLLLMGVG